MPNGSRFGVYAEHLSDDDSVSPQCLPLNSFSKNFNEDSISRSGRQPFSTVVAQSEAIISHSMKQPIDSAASLDKLTASHSNLIVMVHSAANKASLKIAAT